MLGKRFTFAVTFLIGLALTGAGLVSLLRGAALPLPALTPSLEPRPQVQLLPGTPEPEAAASPTPEPSWAPAARLIIEKLGVDAPVVEKGVAPLSAVFRKLGVNAPPDNTPTMDIPDSAYDVAIYPSISGGHPGHPGNSVFSGHVDLCCPKPVRGVFWGLRNLKDGDTIRVKLEDGTEYAYRVTRNWLVKATNAPTDQIIGPPAEGEEPEVITLITCGGTFVPRPGATVGLYEDRVIVRAVRVHEETALAPPSR